MVYTFSAGVTVMALTYSKDPLDGKCLQLRRLMSLIGTMPVLANSEDNKSYCSSE